MDESGRQRLIPIPGGPPSLLNLPPGCPFMPRCPMSRERCGREEPELSVTNHSQHLAACYFHTELVGVGPADVFETTSADVSVGQDLHESTEVG
jgi:hypothetical protein